MKKGFTLAEVLITLAVLGIVGAATIYVIRNVIPEESVYTSKKASVTLSSGVKTLLEDDSKYQKKEFNGGQEFCLQYTGMFKNPGKITCGQNQNMPALLSAIEKGLPQNSNVYNNSNLVTSSGEVWWGLNQQFVGDNPITIVADVNGPKKGKNRIGEDIVVMNLYKNGKIGTYEKSNTSTGTEEAPEGGKCELISSQITRENLSDTAANEAKGVVHRLCFQERQRCVDKNGHEQIRKIGGETCIECPDIDGKKWLVNTNGTLVGTADSDAVVFSSLATNIQGATESARKCNIENLASLQKKIPTIASINPLDEIKPYSVNKDKVFEKEKHLTGYFGKPHLIKVQNLHVTRMYPVLVNKYVKNLGSDAYGAIVGLTPDKVLLWNVNQSSNTINRSLALDGSLWDSKCGRINAKFYKKRNKGFAFELSSADTLKMLSKGNEVSNNLSCGYEYVCQSIERNGSGTAYEKFKEFDVPFTLAKRDQDGYTKCGECKPVSRKILKISKNDASDSYYTYYGSSDSGDTKFKKLCTQSKRDCSVSKTGIAGSDKFSSEYPKSGDGNINLGDYPYKNATPYGCKDCNLADKYFLKTSHDAGTATESNSTALSGNTYTYMTACTQVSRTCEGAPEFNVGFNTDKNANLLGCSACYSEHEIVNRTTAATCKVKRICSKGDQNGTNMFDNAYKNYGKFDTGFNNYSCGCETLSKTQNANHTFKYCRNVIGSNCSKYVSGFNSTGTYEFDIDVSKDKNKEVYKLRRNKNDSDNKRNADQIKEYKDYNPVGSENLIKAKDKLTPYFLMTSCSPNSAFSCDLVSRYNESTNSFKVRIKIKEKCVEKCDTQAKADTYTACHGSCKEYKTIQYSCATESQPNKKCTKKVCVRWNPNNACMTYVAQNQQIGNVSINYTYADPNCSNPVTPMTPASCTTCDCICKPNNTSCCPPAKKTLCRNPSVQVVDPTCKKRGEIITSYPNKDRGADCPEDIEYTPMKCCGEEINKVKASSNVYSVGNCTGNTGSSADLVMSNPCAANRTDEWGFVFQSERLTNKDLDSAQFKDVKIKITIAGIDQSAAGYRNQEGQPAIKIMYGNSKVKTIYLDNSNNGTLTVDLGNFTGAPYVSLQMKAGNYCGSGTRNSWGCSCGSHGNGKHTGDGSSCTNGCAAVCPNGTVLSSVVNPWDGWTLTNVRITGKMVNTYDKNGQCQKE